MLHMSGRMLSEEEANERFEDADEDSNGEVTWIEYAKNSFGDDTDFSDDHLEGAQEKVSGCYNINPFLCWIHLKLFNAIFFPFCT